MEFLQKLLSEEFKARGCECPVKVSFVEEPGMAKERFVIAQEGDNVTITARRKRGLIFGLGRLLRKLEIKDGKASLACDISGDFSPRMPIRGHQLGYRGNNNTYDAWTPAQFRRYQLEMMFFGTNIAEHVPDESGNCSELMPIPPNEMLVEVSRICAELDMDLGLWYPVDEKQPIDEAHDERERIFKSLPRLDYVFIPGSDPGRLPPDELFARGEDYAGLMKAVHPGSEMWISAQMPHNSPWWPGQFKAELEKEPEWLDGVIMGPNHAFSTERLRRITPSRYGVRLYPDITHNVRCEYPVHYNLDDWHYAMASTLSRESVNPRPREFQMLHRQTRGFLTGSVSYSEGVNDDVNKMIWTDMDWFGNDIQLRETLEDYARLYLWGADPARAADGIFMMEMNWQGDPAENPGIDDCLALWEDLLAKTPSLAGNWRFNLLLFRAKCDAFVRQKRLFELAAIARGDIDAQYPVIGREMLFPLAKDLFDQIGIQLDVENFGGLRWERGCVLDTIDRPITDLPWLQNQKKRGLLEQSLKRNEVANDEFYYSFNLHARNTLACPQVGEFYLNFHGDRPDNDGTLSICALQIFDNLVLRARLGGFTPGQDYKLRVTWFRPEEKSDKYKITANGNVILDGKFSDGAADPDFDAAMLGKDYLQTRTYDLPAGVFENGCLALEFTEPFVGVMLNEFWVLKA